MQAYGKNMERWAMYSQYSMHEDHLGMTGLVMGLHTTKDLTPQSTFCLPSIGARAREGQSRQFCMASIWQLINF